MFLLGVVVTLLVLFLGGMLLAAYDKFPGGTDDAWFGFTSVTILTLCLICWLSGRDYQKKEDAKPVAVEVKP